MRPVRHDAVIQKVIEALFGCIFVVGEFRVRICKSPVADPLCRDRLHVAVVEVSFESPWMLRTQVAPMALHARGYPIAHNHFVHLRAWWSPSLLYELIGFGQI